VSELETRVKYLEKVVNNIISNKMSTDKKSKAGSPVGTPPVDPIAAETKAPAAANYGFKLSAPRFRTMYQGNLVTVDAEMINADPALLKHLQDNYPECFITE
jgi:hypothetical protein